MQLSKVCYYRFDSFEDNHLFIGKHTGTTTLINTVYTSGNTHTSEKKTAAATHGVPLLDAVFVPRALREVCLLAEPF